MTALVTGASGFVGGALWRRLMAEGCAVRAASRRTLRPPAGSSTAIIPDIGAATDWSDALEDVDTVFHLAAHVHVNPGPGARDPKFDEVNVAGTRVLAEQAARAGVRRLVFVSSIKVCGECGTFTERSPLQPAGAYAISKQAAEAALHAVQQRTGLEITIVRSPLVYGPGVGANFLALFSAVAHRRPLPVAAIRNRRSLIFVGNLVDALIVAAGHPAAAGATFLLSDADDRSTPDLVRAIGASLGTPPVLIPVPVGVLRFAGRLAGRSAAIDRLTSTLVADTTKIRTDLGWRPPFSVEQGLRDTAAWYRACGRWRTGGRAHDVLTGSGSNPPRAARSTPRDGDAG